MCGISGFNFKDESLIKKMNALLAHRGPDAGGFYVGENISLGHRRLSIIDLSEAGAQPMSDANGRYWITFNGEIYNFQELRRKLEGKYKFRSQTDTEVIIYSYMEWGRDCLKKFNGIFSFAIWDKNKEELFLARDPAGVKPLYYYFDGKELIFASEIKAILEAGVPREIDFEAFNLYFRLLYVPAPFTMFKNIRKLLPGSYLVFGGDKLDIKKYWEINDFREYESYDEAKADIEKIIKDSVCLQLVSDRSVGVFLSGGIDSTAILGMARELAPQVTKTFSIGFDIFEESEKFNADFKLARETAKFYGADHHELLMSGRDAAEVLEAAVWHMDEPVANPTVLPTFLLSRETKKEVAVVLGGDGGDELFGGYLRHYYAHLAGNYLEWLPKNMEAAAMKMIIAKFNSQKINKIKSIILPAVYSGQSFKNFLNTNFVHAKNDFSREFMLFDLKTWLPDESLVRTDKMTMAHGLEQRVPILDLRLMECAFKVSSKWKIDNKAIGKKIWRDAVEKYLPPHIRGEKKRGWFSPAAKWLRKEMKDAVYESFGDLDNDLFNKQECLHILDKHVSQKEYNLNIVWALFVWQIWKKIYKL